MPDRAATRRMKEVVQSSLAKDDIDAAIKPGDRMFVVSTRFVPHGLPLDHPIREFHDDRACTDNAPNGFWNVDIWDVDNDAMPVARACFVDTRSRVLCDRLSVERAYVGHGLGRRMIDLGEALWGNTVFGGAWFRDEEEGFWCSPA